MQSEWKEYQLQDVVSILGDGIHGTPKYDETGEYYFINGNNLDNGRIKINNKTKKSSREEYIKYKKNLNDRTILVSINGTIGNVAIYNGEKVFLGKSACYFNVLESVERLYIRYVLVGYQFQNYINLQSTGSTIKNVSLKLMRNFTFHMPSLNTQKKIASILSSLDDKIEINRQINKTLEEMAQAIFKSWFVDFEPVKAKIEARKNGLDPELAAMSVISGKSIDELAALKKQSTTSNKVYDELTHTASLFPDELVESELGLIPKGWEAKPLNHLFIPKKGKNITKKTIIEGAVPVVAGGLNPAYFHNIANVFAPVTTISASGANAGFVNLYHQNIWASDCSYVSKEQTKYVYATYLFFKSRQDEITQMQQGAAQPHVYPKDLMRLVLPVAPEKHWNCLENIIIPIFLKIKEHTEENDVLSKFRDTLLPKLLSGELSVSDTDRGNV